MAVSTWRSFLWCSPRVASSEPAIEAPEAMCRAHVVSGVLTFLLFSTMNQQNSSEQKKRFRDYGFSFGLLPIGPTNTISDVGGVLVGHATRIESQNIRTGVTIIDPGTKDLFHKKIPAASAVGNGHTKSVGLTQIDECGTLEVPIALTNTLAVGPVMRGMVDLVQKVTPDLGPLDSINVVVGEINDGRVNDLHANTILAHDVLNAYKNRSKILELGSVGAGTGARAFSWKGGIGSTSRQITVGTQTYTFGVLVLTNYGGALTILGVPVWKTLGKTDFTDFLPKGADGSCITICATDAPLTSRQLGRIARRTFLALGKTGAILAHASGDITVAFSTSGTGLEGSGEIGACLRDTDLNPFFLAAIEATEESVYDALFLGTTMTGRDGYTLEELPIETVVELLRKAGVGS